MGQLHDLQAIFEDILGSRHVYFQPPSTVKMSYPCIVYRRNKVDEKRANNKLYLRKQGYQITVIDKDPDSLIPGKVLELPLCSFDRNYTADNLNHDVFNIYY
jgi:hypothetical protein